jgi:hypothetical protein
MIQYGKNTVTAFYCQPIDNGHKRTYLLQAQSIRDIEEKIEERKRNIEERLDVAIGKFIDTFSIRKEGENTRWMRHEDWIKGEDFIDKIPRDCIIHDTIFKKVYGDGIEFKGGENQEPVAHMKNYIKNRALENVSPEIAQDLSVLKQMTEDALRLSARALEVNASTSQTMHDFSTMVIPIMAEHAIHMKSHTQAFKHFVKIIKATEQKKIRDFQG